MNKIKRWLRKKYVMWKYNHNWNTGKVVVLKEHDKRYGLTKMMLADCFANDCALFLPYELDKIYLFPSADDREKYGKYLLSKMDIKMGACNGRELAGVITDNHCTYEDIKFLHDNNIEIVNGFVYMDIAA